MEKINRTLSIVYDAMLDCNTETRFLRLLGRYNRIRFMAWGYHPLSNRDMMRILYMDLKQRT